MFNHQSSIGLEFNKCLLEVKLSGSTKSMLQSVRHGCYQQPWPVISLPDSMSNPIWLISMETSFYEIGL
jgi:hypothetical protein